MAASSKSVIEVCSIDRPISPRRKLAFVFSGHGSQWVGMGRQLLAQESVFRAAMEECDQAISKFVDWSLLKEIGGDELPLKFEQIAYVQPIVFAMQVSLAALWRSWEVEPDVVVGHSMGEVAAAHVAGALSLEDAARVICCRSQVLKQASGKGAMAAIGLSFEEAQAALAGYEDHLSIAAINSPWLTVLSGDSFALESLISTLKHQQVFCRWINVDVASHSPQIAPLLDCLRDALTGLQPRRARVPFYSTVSAKASEGRDLDASYWVRNVREPVRFSSVVQQLVEDGYDLFLEISPHPILLPAIQQGLLHQRREGTVLPSLRRRKEERAILLTSLSILHSLRRTSDASWIDSTPVYQ